MIIADTSGLLAALDPDELNHDACRRVVETATEPLIMSPFVLCELDYLVTRKLGTVAELLLLGDVAAGAYRLAQMGPGDVAAARTVIDRYRDLGIGLTDASVAVLADRHATADILTLDQRHFRAMRRPNGESFRLLPDDG